VTTAARLGSYALVLLVLIIEVGCAAYLAQREPMWAWVPLVLVALWLAARLWVVQSR
jgi:hypothetical protein